MCLDPQTLFFLLGVTRFLCFQLNYWKSLLCSLISSASFLVSSIYYIAQFVDWSIYVFGLSNSRKKLHLSCFGFDWCLFVRNCENFHLKCFMWKIHFAFYEKENIILVYLRENIALVALLRRYNCIIISIGNEMKLLMLL